VKKIETKKDGFSLSKYDAVTVTTMNHLVEIQYMEKQNHKCNIKKLSKDEYLDLDTGEIKEYEHIENREGSYNSLRQTFKKLRYLINNNFSAKRNELFITLTYRDDMKDAKRLYLDSDKFMKRLRYKYRDKTTIDYLSVIEPQGNGRWHVHCLMKFNDLHTIYIPNDVPVNAPLYDLWGQGWVFIKSLNEVDNIGAYLSAYLGDIELTDKNVVLACDDECKVVEKVVDGKKKKFIKGGRLHMYPPGMNLFRKSKGIVYPDRKRMTYEEAKK